MTFHNINKSKIKPNNQIYLVLMDQKWFAKGGC